MLKTFSCPKCGAPVSYEQDVIGANLTARCSYCNSALAVPDEMRGRPAHVIVDLRGAAEAGKTATKWIVVLILVPVIAVIIGAIAMGGFLIPMFTRSTSSVKTVTSTKPPPTGRTTATKPKPDPFATELLKFGSEGIGPGMFKDARAIAVDASGKIYVGEYIGGRIQVFDADGKFLTQWEVDRKMPLRGLAADRNGNVYIVQSGNISKHEGASGALLGKLAYADGWGFDNVVSTADGGLVAAWYKNRDDIVRFNSQGQVTRTIRGAISSVTEESELDTHVAVDGLGNIYALGTFSNAVFKFDSNGKYLTRFGSDGDQPGQFRAPQAIAVDGNGRVFVSDFKGVQVFDANGRYLTVFDPGDAMASGMVFNDKNELFVVARKQVLKLALKAQ